MSVFLSERKGTDYFFVAQYQDVMMLLMQSFSEGQSFWYSWSFAM